MAEVGFRLTHYVSLERDDHASNKLFDRLVGPEGEAVFSHPCAPDPPSRTVVRTGPDLTGGLGPDESENSRCCKGTVHPQDACRGK